MAKYDFRVLLETVEGQKTSYMSQSFVDTSVDLVLSSSQVYNRITGSVSSSYQNRTIFSGSDFNTLFTFKDNNILSASLSGSLQSGSIVFTALNGDYDRLLRYKFVGSDKVCNVLGLPSNQWVYVDQFRLPTDDENNYFEGNINAKNLFVRDDFTFTGTSNLNSNLPIAVDTGSDRYIQFIDYTGIPKNALLVGYDQDDNVYEISSSTNHIFNIEGVNEYTGGNAKFDNSVDINKLFITTNAEKQSRSEGVAIHSGDILLAPGNYVAIHDADDSAGNNYTPSLDNNTSLLFNDGIIDFRAGVGGLFRLFTLSQSSAGFGFKTNENLNPNYTLQVKGSSFITGSLDVSGSITAKEYIVSSSVINVTTLAQSGSTNFGDTPADDTHKFTGSLNITGSVTALSFIGNSADFNDITASGNLNIVGHITSSGEISSSDKIHAVQFLSDGNNIGSHVDGTTIISSTLNKTTLNGTNIKLGGPVTASGNISSSGQLIAASADFNDGNITNVGVMNLDTIKSDSNSNTMITMGNGSIEITDNGAALLSPKAVLEVAGDLRVSTHITASGNISGSVISTGSFGEVQTRGNLLVNSDLTGSTALSNGAFNLNYGTHGQLTGSLAANGDGYGDIVKIGGTITAKGSMYYLDTDSTWTLTNGTDDSAGADKLLAIALGTNSNIDGMLLKGFVKLNAAGTTVVGAPIYMRASAGNTSFVVNTTSGNIVRIVGYCLTGGEQMYFNPDTTFVEVA